MTRAFIDFLVGNGTPLSKFHLIGHSAGTHFAGGAGAEVTSGKIPRITGNKFVGAGFQALFIENQLKNYFCFVY
jgi:hypothetical protein